MFRNCWSGGFLKLLLTFLGSYSVFIAMTTFTNILPRGKEKSNWFEGCLPRLLPSHHSHIGPMICLIGCCVGVNFVALICWRTVRSSSLLGNGIKMRILDGSCQHAYFRHALHSKRATPVCKSSLAKQKQDSSCPRVLDRRVSGLLSPQVGLN